MMSVRFQKLLTLLIENKIDFTFQCQGKNGYYNLSINDPKGRNHSLGSKYLADIDEGLNIMWGHLISDKDNTSMLTARLPGMTVVPPMPRPF